MKRNRRRSRGGLQNALFVATLIVSAGFQIWLFARHIWSLANG